MHMLTSLCVSSHAILLAAGWAINSPILRAYNPFACMTAYEVVVTCHQLTCPLELFVCL